MPLLTVKDIERLIPAFKGKAGNAAAEILRKILSIETLSSIYDDLSDQQGADFAGGVLKDVREQAKNEEKNVDKLHGEIWEAVVEKNDDEQSIELRELGRRARELTFLWATIAAEAERGADEV